jgi:hypothetical protein
MLSAYAMVACRQRRKAANEKAMGLERPAGLAETVH